MTPNPISALALISFLFISIAIPDGLEAAEIEIENASDEAMRLYVNDGHNYEFEGIVGARSRAKVYQTEPGETWAFAEVRRGEVKIIKERTVKVWGRNELFLSNRDLVDNDHNHGGGGGGGMGDFLRGEITIFNRSSIEVDVYADHGTGWHKEGTLQPGARRTFKCARGDDWGVDDARDRTLDLVGVTTIRNFDVLPSLTVVDRDFGIRPPPILEGRKLTVVNRSRHAVDLYANHGGGWHFEATVPAGIAREYDTDTGDRWAIDNPERRGLNVIREIEIRGFGFNQLTITEDDIHGDAGPPAPAPSRGVAITIRNESDDRVTVYRKTGLFNKSYVDVVRSMARKTFDFLPGEQLVIDGEDDDDKIKYQVPSRNAVVTIPD